MGGWRFGQWLLALSLLGCDGQASADDCQRAQTRYLDLLLREHEELRALPPPQAHAAREMLHAVKLGEPGYQKLQLRCETEVRLAAIKCARKAEGVEQWQACLQ